MGRFALVRNGHTRSKQLWAGSDRDRPLSARGRQQALGVAENLAVRQPVRLVCSPTVRSRQTLDPLALHIGLPVVTDPALSSDASVGDLDRLLRDGWADDAVLCSQGRVLRHLLRRWCRQERELRFDGDHPEGGRIERGAAWLVDAGPHVRTLRYLRPVQVGPNLSAGTSPTDP